MSYQNGGPPTSENSDAAPGPGDAPLAVTFFTDYRAASSQEKRLTLRQLAWRIRTTTRPEKAGLPWIKLARFGAVRTDKGSLRHDSNVLAVSGIEADYDGEKISFDEARETLLKAGVRALLYTSPSHTPEKPRWRILCPFFTEHPPAQRAQFMGRLQGLFGGAFAAESFTLSQSYYFGSVQNNPAHRVEVWDGESIDLAHDLDKTWKGKPGTKAGTNGAAVNGAGANGAAPHSGPLDEAAMLADIREGRSYHTATMRLLGKWVRDGVPYAEAWARIQAEFDKVFPGDRDERWHQRRADMGRCFDDIYGKERATGAAHDETEDATIARLAQLPQLKYERVREAEAQRLGCRVGILDRLVSAERGDGDGARPGQGRALCMPAPEPWPEAVEGADLLDALADYFKSHLVLPEGAAEAMALWILHTHCFTLFSFTPRLLFKAIEPGSGKSTAMELLKGVVPKPLETETCTAAFLFRTIELMAPTLLLDEADTFLRDNEEMRGLVNAGVKAGGQAGRCVGEDQEPRLFACHTPIALAGLGNLAPTIEDRAIRIHMVRRLPSEKIEPIEDATRQLAGKLQRQAARWTADHADTLRAARPDMGALINRAADRWRPLYAIADAAGGDWPARARTAAAALTPADDDARSLGLQLLADIRTVVMPAELEDLAKPKPEFFISSSRLVSDLVAMEGRPWAELGRARKPLTTHRLARMLRDYGIKPANHGPDRESRERGYRFRDFDDAFERNLPPPPS